MTKSGSGNFNCLQELAAYPLGRFKEATKTEQVYAREVAIFPIYSVTSHDSELFVRA